MPLDVDELVVKQAAARGLSYQAAVREAMVLWLKAKDPSRKGEEI
jgi:predicted DNA binding CopG/RHH family protein